MEQISNDATPPNEATSAQAPQQFVPIQATIATGTSGKGPITV